MRKPTSTGGAEWGNCAKAVLGVLVALSLVAGIPTGGAGQDRPQAQALNDWGPNLGRWACECRTLGDGAHSFTATGELTRELDGHAYLWRWAEAESSEHRNPLKDIELWGYDPTTSRVVKAFVNREGPRYPDEHRMVR